MPKKTIAKTIEKLDKSLKKEKDINSIVWKWQQIIALEKQLEEEMQK